MTANQISRLPSNFSALVTTSSESPLNPTFPPLDRISSRSQLNSLMRLDSSTPYIMQNSKELKLSRIYKSTSLIYWSKVVQQQKSDGLGAHDSGFTGRFWNFTHKFEPRLQGLMKRRNYHTRHDGIEFSPAVCAHLQPHPCQKVMWRKSACHPGYSMR